MKRKNQPHITPAYAGAARAAANKAGREFAAAEDAAHATNRDDRLAARRAYSTRMEELNRLIREAERTLSQANAAADQKRDASINKAKGDRRAARTLRIEILDEFATTGEESAAITALNSLAE